MITIEKVIKECEKLSFEENAAFPVVVKKLAEVGIERYYADLIRLEKTFYTQGLETYRNKLPLQETNVIEKEFCEEKVRNALNTIQRAEINYATFLKRIMHSGVVSYTVFIHGAQAHYIGRKGEIWIEHFPGNKS